MSVNSEQYTTTRQQGLSVGSIGCEETVLKLTRAAIAHQRKGDLADAEACCHSILNISPRNPEATHLLGVIHQQSGRKESAIELVNVAIRICPSNPCYYNTLGSLWRSKGQVEKAKHCYQKALRLKPDYAEAIYNMAGLYHLAKNFIRALRHYQHAVAVKPLFPEALNNMAATLNMLDRFDEAVDCCKQAIRIQPNYSEAFNNMGNAYKKQGRLARAIACYEKSITLSGESPEVLCNLANALQDRGEIDPAIVMYEKAIRLNPEYGKAYNDLGTAYRSNRQLEAAERQFKISVRRAPDDAEAYHNLGNVYYDKGDFDQAALWYDKAISIDQESVQTRINRGIIFQETGESDKALYCFDKAMTFDPQNSKAYCHLVHELYQRCDWRRIDSLNIQLDQLTRRELTMGHRPNEMPFLSLIRSADPSINYKIAQRWSQEISRYTAGKDGSGGYKHTRKKRSKITIGYLSNNFRDHPTSHLISDIFGVHDRNRFTINAYSYGDDDGSRYRDKIRQTCDSFIDLRESTHVEAARHIFNDRVDILVDLVGYMRGNRIEICAYRPAPVQMRWLGLAGTTGADFFDYLVTDEIVTPRAEERYYSENLIFMPYSYQVNSQPITNSNRTCKREDFGLPEKAFVYCCFCSNYKIDAHVFHLWMRILKQTQGSVLWLMAGDPVVAENLKIAATREDVAPNRIIFAKKMNKPDHLQRLGLADLALDTISVNGAATTSDALRAGVPVVTVEGTHFASRMSESILTAVGLHELTARDLAQYEKMAVELGNHPEKRRLLLEKMERNQMTQPLFDTRRFVRSIEDAYVQAWELYQCEESPRHIDAEDFGMTQYSDKPTALINHKRDRIGNG